MALTDTTLAAGEAQRVLAHWGIEVAPGQVSPGSGTANASAVISLPAERLFLKRRNPRYARVDWVRFDQALLSHLVGRGLAVPVAVPSRSGEPWVADGGSIYELFRYIDGDSHRSGDPIELAAAGRTLARIHRASVDFEPRVAKPWPRFHDPRDLLEWLPELLDVAGAKAESAERLSALEQALALARRLAARLPDGRYWSLPSAIVHGDYHAGNLKFRDGRVVGVFDWDWSSSQPRMVDLADGLLFLCGRRRSPVVAGDIWSLTESFRIDRGRVRAFGLGYAGELSPTACELEALPDLMRCRWLYCRVDAAMRKVEPARRGEFVARELATVLQDIDDIEADLVDGSAFSSAGR